MTANAHKRTFRLAIQVPDNGHSLKRDLSYRWGFNIGNASAAAIALPYRPRRVLNRSSFDPPLKVFDLLLHGML